MQVGRHDWTTHVEEGESYKVCAACGKLPRASRGKKQEGPYRDTFERRGQFRRSVVGHTKTEPLTRPLQRARAGRGKRPRRSARRPALSKVLALQVELCSPGLIASCAWGTLAAFGLSAGVLAAGPVQPVYSP